MKLVNEFRVPVSADEAWKVLTDVERVAPCIPGAQLVSVDGDEFTGTVKVKVGPITVSYMGDAAFHEKDVAAQRVVIKANGKETRGSGTAAALVTAQLHEDTSGTVVAITTDLTISGKAAQFGRGVLADVANNLISQFAKRLEADVLGGSAAAETGSAPAQFAAAAPEAESVDLLKMVGLPVAKRAAPVAAGLAVGIGIGFLLGRRARKTPTDDLLAALTRLVS